jgi:hypothetical protein
MPDPKRCQRCRFLIKGPVVAYKEFDCICVDCQKLLIFWDAEGFL